MKRKKRSRDENEMAFGVISQTIKAAEKKGGAAQKSLISEAAKALSKLGASKGGKALPVPSPSICQLFRK